MLGFFRIIFLIVYKIETYMYVEHYRVIRSLVGWIYTFAWISTGYIFRSFIHYYTIIHFLEYIQSVLVSLQFQRVFSGVRCIRLQTNFCQQIQRIGTRVINVMSPSCYSVQRVGTHMMDVVSPSCEAQFQTCFDLYVIDLRYIVGQYRWLSARKT